jgi:hypothetical protein
LLVNFPQQPGRNDMIRPATAGFSIAMPMLHCNRNNIASHKKA